MDKAEGWNMYLEIQDLKKKHFNEGVKGTVLLTLFFIG
jgi:hypothetical protein